MRKSRTCTHLAVIFFQLKVTLSNNWNNKKNTTSILCAIFFQFNFIQIASFPIGFWVEPWIKRIPLLATFPLFEFAVYFFFNFRPNKIKLKNNAFNENYLLVIDRDHVFGELISSSIHFYRPLLWTFNWAKLYGKIMVRSLKNCFLKFCNFCTLQCCCLLSLFLTFALPFIRNATEVARLLVHLQCFVLDMDEPLEVNWFFFLRNWITQVVLNHTNECCCCLHIVARV